MTVHRAPEDGCSETSSHRSEDSSWSSARSGVPLATADIAARWKLSAIVVAGNREFRLRPMSSSGDARPSSVCAAAFAYTHSWRSSKRTHPSAMRSTACSMRATLPAPMVLGEQYSFPDRRKPSLRCLTFETLRSAWVARAHCCRRDCTYGVHGVRVFQSFVVAIAFHPGKAQCETPPDNAGLLAGR